MAFLRHTPARARFLGSAFHFETFVLSAASFVGTLMLGSVSRLYAGQVRESILQRHYRVKSAQFSLGIARAKSPRYGMAIRQIEE